MTAWLCLCGQRGCVSVVSILCGWSTPLLVQVNSEPMGAALQGNQSWPGRAFLPQLAQALQSRRRHFV